MKKPPSFVVSGPLEPGGLVSLADEERRHARARRLRPGAVVRLVDGEGSVGTGTIERFDRSALEVRVDEIRADPVAAFSILVLAPVLRASRLSWLVEKATELGASKIVLVESSRAQGDRAEEAQRDGGRLGRIAREAAKQCGRTSFPSIEGPVSFGEASLLPAGRRLLLDPSGEPFPPSLSESSVALWSGPEGGFTPAELAAAGRAGWERVRLAGSVLRAETAVLAALALAARAIDSAAGRADNSPTP
jgi:16S rRNA (uracil1498-N3)-methyltransferase